MTKGPSEVFGRRKGISSPRAGARLPSEMKVLLAAAAMAVSAVGCSNAPHPEPNLPFTFVDGDGDNDNDNNDGSATSGAGAGNPDGSSSTTGSGAGGAESGAGGSEPSGEVAAMKVYKTPTAPTDCASAIALADQVLACDQAGTCEEEDILLVQVGNEYPAVNDQIKEPANGKGFVTVFSSWALPEGVIFMSDSSITAVGGRIKNPAAGSNATPCYLNPGESLGFNLQDASGNLDHGWAAFAVNASNLNVDADRTNNPE